MSIDQGPVIQGALLRAELVRLRRAGNLPRSAVTASLQWSPSKLSGLESGDDAIAMTDLEALLDEYAVPPQRRTELYELARGAERPPWWADYRSDVDEATLRFFGREPGASEIWHFQNAVVPAPLQTEEYATAITTAVVRSRDVARIVGLRMRRRRALAERTDPPRQVYVLDEAAVRRNVGAHSDPQVMPRQLRHIADLAEHDDRVTVRVVPFVIGAYEAQSRPFVILEFGDRLRSSVYLEAISDMQAQSIHTDDAEVVAYYRSAFESVLDEALSGGDSLQLIREAADDLAAGDFRATSNDG